MTTKTPVLAFTMGDPCGIGPEIILQAILKLREQPLCKPLIIGDENVFSQAACFLGLNITLTKTDQPQLTNPASQQWLCWNPNPQNDLSQLKRGAPQAAAGQAAFDCLNGAIDLALAKNANTAVGGTVDGIVTAPLHKEALRMAGIPHPGHTEILAERCATNDFAMMLYLPPNKANNKVNNKAPHANGICVAHATLHTSIKSVSDLLSTQSIEEKISLVDNFLKQLGMASPRVGVCALNPHAGEHGLFGDEEQTLIAPAVQNAIAKGVNAAGPFPADTLLKRAIVDSEFDGVVAMYHDQGHVALKLIAFNRAVNVTLGLPIIRTSPSHGTAFDIVGKTQADATGFWEATRVATSLANNIQ